MLNYNYENAQTNSQNIKIFCSINIILMVRQNYFQIYIQHNCSFRVISITMYQKKLRKEVTYSKLRRGHLTAQHPKNAFLRRPCFVLRIPLSSSRSLFLPGTSLRRDLYCVSKYREAQTKR